jgi:hypothetical protein
MCTPGLCPVSPLDCGVDTLFSQVMVPPSGSWNFLTSDSYYGYIVYDNYLVNAPVCDLHWWGLDLYNDGTNWLECDQVNPQFAIKFYPDDGTGKPSTTAPACTYLLVATAVDTGILYGSTYHLKMYSVDLSPICTQLSGWVSIQGSDTTPDTCVFLWGKGTGGDGVAYQYTPTGGLTAQALDLAFCLTGANGACCFANGACLQLTQAACTSAGGTSWIQGVLCEPLNPCPQPAACCFPNGHCEIEIESLCLSGGGVFHAGETCGTVLPAQYHWEYPIGMPLPPGMEFQNGQDLEDSTPIGPVWIDLKIVGILGPLYITVEHLGTTVVLWNGVCQSSNGMDVVFDDDGSTVNCLNLTGGVHIKPSSAGGGHLSDFWGMEFGGPWIIRVYRSGGTEVIILVRWSLWVQFLDETFICVPVPMGACCFPDGSCQHLSQADCTAQGGTEWHYAVPCSYANCAQPGDNCSNPLPPGFFGPGSDPFEGDVSTCGHKNDYSDTCLVDYDGGEDLIARFVVTETVCLNITATGNTPSDNFIGIAVDDECPPAATGCLAMATSGSGTVASITELQLTPGTYWLMIDTQPPPTCVNCHLSIAVCAPRGACCFGGVCQENLTAVECLAQGGVWKGANSDCFPNPCVPINYYWDFTTGEQGGDGYNGQWIYYPYAPDGPWYNMWWSNEFAMDREKEITFTFTTGFPIVGGVLDAALVWATSDWPLTERPPLASEEQYIQRQFLDTITVPGTYTFTNRLTFCPRWVSIDVRGYGYSIEGTINHVCLPLPENWYWKDCNGATADGFMPDFDQRQDFDGDTVEDAGYCGPTAVGNSIWWFDCKFPLAGIVPGTWTPGDLVQDLAERMATNGQTQSPNGHPTPYSGTYLDDMQSGIDGYLTAQGVDDLLYEHTQLNPTFAYINAEVQKSQDVTLLVGFWHVEAVQPWGNPPNAWTVTWKRAGGHYLTVAGVDPLNSRVALSDPDGDFAEHGYTGVVRPAGTDHNHDGDNDPNTTISFRDAAYDHAVHNNDTYASHDYYALRLSISPGGQLALVLDGDPLAYGEQMHSYHEDENNGPFDPNVLIEKTITWGDLNQLWPIPNDPNAVPVVCQYYSEIEAAVVVSPFEECGPQVGGLACEPVVCPVQTEQCLPKKIRHHIPQVVFPPAGIDHLSPTSGYVVMQAPSGQTETYVIGEGPPNMTTVIRESPVDMGGYRVFDTEITQLDLVGSRREDDVQIRESPTLQSSGHVVGAVSATTDYPADSFFDLFVEIDIPDLGVYGLRNNAPIPLASYGIEAVPPLGAIYNTPSPWEGVELYTPGGDPTGYRIVGVTHVLPPALPQWEVIECECIDPNYCHIQLGDGHSCVGGCPTGYDCTELGATNPDGSVDIWCDCLPTPVGACCQRNGACAVTTQAGCPAPGVWHPEWTSCTPNPCPCLVLGDLNHSWTVDGVDIQGFVDCLLGSSTDCRCGDFNGNGVVDMGDMSDFIAVLLNP